jgi:predicted RNA binding protein YcfA (HicA-like mRNA interferase family)
VSKLSPISWKELVRRLHQLGFEGPYEGAKHPYMIKGDLVLTIPNPHRKDIGVDLLMKILKRGNISRGEWLRAG